MIAARSWMMRSFFISVAEAHLLEVEVHQLAFFFGRQIPDVDHDREAIGRRFREGERALSELDRVHRRDREVERRQLVGLLADGHGAILQAFEERALRLERDAVDLVEQDDFRFGERAHFGGQRPGRGIDHLEADDFGRLQVGASLDARELGVADRREDHAEERLADARHAAQQQVAGVDLPLLLLVVSGRNLRQEHDVGQDLGLGITDEGLAAFRENGFVEGDRFYGGQDARVRLENGNRIPTRARIRRKSRWDIGRDGGCDA